jgi:hypothetical protein
MQCVTLNIHFHSTNLFILLKISSFFYVCGPTFFCLKHIIFLWQLFLSFLFCVATFCIYIPERPPCPLWLSTGYLLLKFKGAKNWLPTYTHTHTHTQKWFHWNGEKSESFELKLIVDSWFSFFVHVNKTKHKVPIARPQNVFIFKFKFKRETLLLA